MSLKPLLTLVFALFLIARTGGSASAQPGPQGEAIPTAREGDIAALPRAAPKRTARRPGPIAADPFESLRQDAEPATRAWIAGHRAETRAKLIGNPRYGPELAAVRASLERRSAPQLIGADVHQLFQNAAHPQGVWRRARLEAFARGKPQWEPLLDVDALARSEGRGWAWGGATCAPAPTRRCMVRLSDGQRVSVREFDLGAKAFTPGGLRLAEADAFAWLDRDTLLVAVGEGQGAGATLRIKRLTRGGTLATAAEALRVEARTPEDRLVPLALSNGEGPPLEAAVVERAGRAAEFQVRVDGAYRRLPLAEDFAVVGVVGGRLVFQLNQGWTDPTLEVRLGAGQLLAFNLDQIVKRRPELTPEPVLALSGRPYILQSSVTRSAVLLKVRENDGVRLYACTPGRLGWSVRRVALPEDGVVDSVAAAADGDDVLVGLERFPRPTAYALANAVTPSVSLIPPEPLAVKSPALTIEPSKAVARDGAPLEYLTAQAAGASGNTRPMLVLARPDVALALDPAEVDIGAAWLASGGAVAVITQRDRAIDVRNVPLRTLLAYNDLASLAQDLVKRGLAAPGKVALLGVGDGGLAAGIAGQRFRRLWSAVALVDPALDLLRPERSAAGRRLTARYGDLRDLSIRRFWDETAPYDNLKPGVAYPPTLLIETGASGLSDARRLDARMEAAGAPALFDSFDQDVQTPADWPEATLDASVVTFLQAAS